MFEVKANTVIQIEAPKSEYNFYWSKWVPYTTKETKLYDKHEVYDAISVANNCEMPEWMRRNITEFNKVILVRNNKYAMVNPKDIVFLN